MIRLPEVLPEPERPKNLTEDAKWLAGEGAGSWFVIKQIQDKLLFEVRRFSPEGLPECIGIFKPEGSYPRIDKPYIITYPSHCNIITISQEDSILRLIYQA